MNVLRRDRQLTALHMLVEGMSLRSVSRVTGIHRTTVQNLLVRAGEGCAQLADREMRGLKLQHLQLDEIWTFCGKKQKNLARAEKQDPELGDQYLFVALDTDTKLIPSFTLGKRDGDTTEKFVSDLSGRIVMPPPTDDYEQFPMLSTDGWGAYPNAIRRAFGGKVQHGVIIKQYAESEQPGRYAPPEVTGTERRRETGVADLYEICTSHVERQNLTIRTFVKRFNRLTLAFSKKLRNLRAAVSLHMAHYNFCRRHATLRTTPAMAARVTDRLWSLADLYDAVTD